MWEKSSSNSELIWTSKGARVRQTFSHLILKNRIFFLPSNFYSRYYCTIAACLISLHFKYKHKWYKLKPYSSVENNLYGVSKVSESLKQRKLHHLMMSHAGNNLLHTTNVLRKKMFTLGSTLEGQSREKKVIN